MQKRPAELVALATARQGDDLFRFAIPALPDP
jgi:hypothetical protein